MSCYYRDEEDIYEDDMSFGGGHSAHDDEGAADDCLDVENVTNWDDDEHKVYCEHGYDDTFEDDDADSQNETPKEPTGYHTYETMESVAYSGSNDPLNSTDQDDDDDYGKYGDYGDYSRYGECGDYSGESVPSINGDSTGSSNGNNWCSPGYTIPTYTKASRGSSKTDITITTEEEDQEYDKDGDEGQGDEDNEIFDPYHDLMAYMEGHLEQQGSAYNIGCANLSRLVNEHEHEREGYHAFEINPPGCYSPQAWNDTAGRAKTSAPVLNPSKLDSMAQAHGWILMETSMRITDPMKSYRRGDDAARLDVWPKRGTAQLFLQKVAMADVEQLFRDPRHLL